MSRCTRSPRCRPLVAAGGFARRKREPGPGGAQLHGQRHAGRRWIFHRLAGGNVQGALLPAPPIRTVASVEGWFRDHKPKMAEIFHFAPSSIRSVRSAMSMGARPADCYRATSCGKSHVFNTSSQTPPSLSVFSRRLRWTTTRSAEPGSGWGGSSPQGSRCSPWWRRASLWSACCTWGSCFSARC